ncbi:MAG: amidohydrolase family protein [Cyanobium sp.]
MNAPGSIGLDGADGTDRAASTLPPLRLPRCLLDPTIHLPLADSDGLVAVRLRQQEGRLVGIDPCTAAEAAGPLPLALTPLVEPHAHLDKAYSAPPHGNREGTLGGALRANHAEAAVRGRATVLERAERALERAWRHGLRAIRSHIDSHGACGIASWEALAELRQRWAGRVELELVALVPVGHWSTAEGRALAQRAAAAGGLLGGVLGAPFPRTPQDEDNLESALALAEQHGCGVDLHIDESDVQHAEGLRLLVRRLRRRGGGPPLTCSHAASMGMLGERPCQRLAEAMADLGLSVVALPTTNLWLLGRRRGATPRLRAQAPIRQLLAAGVRVAVGGDNVQDPWFPGGDFDPLALLRFTAVASHLVPWQRQGLAPFGSAGAALLGLAWDGVLRLGGPADLVVLGARSWEELLARDPQRRVLRAGRWLPPPEAESPSPLLAGLGQDRPRP